MKKKEQTPVSKVLSKVSFNETMFVVALCIALAGLLGGFYPPVLGLVFYLSYLLLKHFFGYAKDEGVNKMGWHPLVERQNGRVYGYKLFYLFGYELYRMQTFDVEEEEEPQGSQDTIRGRDTGVTRHDTRKSHRGSQDPIRGIAGEVKLSPKAMEELIREKM